MPAFDGVRNLDDLNAVLPVASFMGGWAKHEPSLWREPRTKFRPASWSWRDAKEGLDIAGRHISTELAERRNLFMVNPIEGNHYATLQTLVTAYQMILPGERARSHRHSPNALRLVLDVGRDVYTVVDGVRLDMRPGDVVLTPGGCWHGHANDGDHAGYWIDYLDVPLVHLLGPMFLDHWPAGFQVPERNVSESPYIFAWADTLRALDNADLDPTGRYGARIELGRPALPTIALHMQRMRAGVKTTAYRTTASQIFSVVSGAGRTIVGDAAIAWSRGDVIAAPAWHPLSHVIEEDAVLFSVSDEPTLRALAFLVDRDE